MITITPLIGLGLNASITNGILKNYLLSLPVKRFLYSPASLGLEAFVQSKQNELKTTEDPDSYKTKLREHCNNENCLIFTSDLRKMNKLAESDDDVHLLFQLVKRVCHQDSVLFAPFKLGPDIMRCLYHLNKPDEALSLVKDNETSPLFSQTVTFLLLMNMLYKNNRHHQVIEVFNIVKGLPYIKKFPGSLINLLFASLYKLNTPESYEQGLVHWQEFHDTGLKPPLRAVHFFAMLALKQNHSFAAVELLSNIRPSSVGFNIQVMAYTHAKCYDQVFDLFQNYFFEDRPKIEADYFVTADTFEYLKTLFEKSQDGLICKKLQKLKDEMIIHNFYIEKDLDVFLCEEITYHKNIIDQEKNSLNKREFIQKYNY